jgi:hypothetical protein
MSARWKSNCASWIALINIPGVPHQASGDADGTPGLTGNELPVWEGQIPRPIYAGTFGSCKISGVGGGLGGAVYRRTSGQRRNTSNIQEGWCRDVYGCPASGA